MKQFHLHIFFLSLLAFLPLLSQAQINLDSGLVAFYPFNGNANDSSANAYNGGVFGATISSDRFGNENSAYEFDGIDDHIDNQLIDSSPSYTGTFQILGQPLYVGGQIQHAVLYWQEKIRVFPNPSSSQLNIQSPQAAIQSVKLYDLTGREIPSTVNFTRYETTMRSNYEGIALLKIQTEKGLVVRKIVFE